MPGVDGSSPSPKRSPTACSTARPVRATCSGVAGAETPDAAAVTRGVYPGEHLAGRTAAAAGDPAAPGPGRVRVVGADRAGHRAGPVAPAVLGVPRGRGAG